MGDAKTSSKTKNSLYIKIKKWWEGTKLVFRSTHNMGMTPYMIGTYFCYAILGMTSSIIIFFTSLSYGVFRSKTATKATFLAVNFFSMATAFLIRCYYMNKITEISKCFGNAEWHNTTTLMALKEKEIRSKDNPLYTKFEKEHYSSNDKKEKLKSSRDTDAQYSVSETEKVIASTHKFVQSMIQATVAIISSCLALSSAHLPMMMITVISTLTIISTALLIQFELVTPAKAKYKFAKGDAVAILKKMFSFAKDDEDIQFLNDVKKNMDTAQQKADEFAGYDNTGQLLYRFMTDLSEYIITFTVVTAFIPSFPVTSITGGPFSAGMTAFSGLSLLAMSKSLSSMVKDASAFIRSSGEISEVASGYDAIRNLLEQISTYTQTKLEESCKLFLDPKKKELNYITKNAVECLILGVFISTGFNLYYDAMIISGVINSSTMLAATINSITSWSVGLMTATFAANYYIKSQNKNRSTSDKNHDYGNILFSTSASILIGQILHNTINFINPMASFCVIFTTLMPTMSIIANKYLIPSISNAEKSKIINIHDIAVKANIIEKPNKAKNKAPIKEDTKSKKTDKGIWNNLTRLVC